MNYKAIIDRALVLATEGHYGQKRKGGEPYITHPIAVANIAAELLNHPARWIEIFLTGESDRNALEMVMRVLALGHDLEEDTDMTAEFYINNLVVDAGLDTGLADIMIASLKRLNKNNYPTYLDYILGVKLDPWARLPKIADLTHNISNLDKGSLKEKYELSKYILEN